MADFLVTIDGKYLYWGISLGFIPPLLPTPVPPSIDTPFDPNDYSVIFDDTMGRLQCKGEHIALYDTKTYKFKGYAKVEEFWNTSTAVKATYVSTVPTSDIRPTYVKDFLSLMVTGLRAEVIEPKSAADRIILGKKWLEETTTGYCIKIGIKSFSWPGRYLDYLVDAQGNNVSTEIYSSSLIQNFAGYNYQETTINFTKTGIEHYLPSVKFAKYKRPDGTITSLSASEENIIENIVLTFDALFREEYFVNFIEENNLTYIFDKHFEIILGFDPINFGQELKDRYYDEIFNPRYFALLRVRLLEFYYWARGGGYWSVSKTKMLTRIYGLFDDFTLSQIDFQDKVDTLNFILDDNFWISGRWFPTPDKYKLTEEELIVKIVRTIAREDDQGVLVYDEINRFMDILNDTPKGSADNPLNLYQVLYDAIQDTLFFGDDGKGARGQFVKAVYMLWINSKYNPNSDENELISVNYLYTSYNAQWRFNDPSQTQEFDQGAAPLLINYESDKFLLWYTDNFNFPFRNRKIVALQETSGDFFESVDFYEDVANGYAPYGFYEVFQPISIKSSQAQDTIISIPINGNLDNPCDVNENNNANAIPIFYLKYIDDLGDYSDFKETIGVLLDVVLTFTGIGNIAKARYLTKASVLRRFLLGGVVSLAEKQALVRAIRGISFATWEVVLGTAGTLHNLLTGGCQNIDPCNPPQPGTPAYTQFQKCMAIQKWLFALEILTLSGDLLAKRFFRRASREISPHVINDLTPTQRQFVDDLADLDGVLHGFLNTLQSSHPAVHARVAALPTQEKKFVFMFDFERNVSALDELQLRPHLIDDWAEVVDELAHFRKDIKFLNAYNRFTNKPHEVEHITEFINGSVTGGFDPKGAHAYKNITNGKIRNPSLGAPAPGRPATTIKEAKNGHVCYKNVYFVKPNGDLNKKSMQTIWNPAWNDKRIKGEMAVAFMNKKVSKPTQVGKTFPPPFSPPPQYISTYVSKLSDGTKVEMKIYNFEDDLVTNSIKRDHLGYFQLILK